MNWSVVDHGAFPRRGEDVTGNVIRLGASVYGDENRAEGMSMEAD